MTSPTNTGTGCQCCCLKVFIEGQRGGGGEGGSVGEDGTWTVPPSVGKLLVMMFKVNSK